MLFLNHGEYRKIIQVFAYKANCLLIWIPNFRIVLNEMTWVILWNMVINILWYKWIISQFHTKLKLINMNLLSLLNTNLVLSPDALPDSPWWVPVYSNEPLPKLSVVSHFFFFFSFFQFCISKHVSLIFICRLFLLKK